MNKEKVIQIVEFYRDAEKAVRLNERIIKNLEDQYYISISGINLDELPHGKSIVSNPIERVVMNIPKTVSNTIKDLKKQNDKFCKVKAEILKEMNCLTFSQKTIIFDFYIHGYQWERISGQINYSVRQCKNIRNRAVEKLAKRFGINKLILSCHFPAK